MRVAGLPSILKSNLLYDGLTVNQCHQRTEESMAH